MRHININADKGFSGVQLNVADTILNWSIIAIFSCF